MSLKPAIIINHAIKFNTVEEFALQFSSFSGLPYFMMPMNGQHNLRKIPKAFYGWLAYFEAGESDLEKGGCMEFKYHNKDKDIDFSFYVGIDSLEISSAFYTGKWSYFLDLAKEMSEYKYAYPGKCSFEETHDTLRTEIYQYFKAIGCSEMLIFCRDFHPYWHTNYGRRDITYQKILTYCKENLLLSKYHELIHLPKDFDENVSNFKNLCIHDTFDDIKLSEKRTYPFSPLNIINPLP